MKKRMQRERIVSVKNITLWTDSFGFLIANIEPRRTIQLANKNLCSKKMMFINFSLNKRKLAKIISMFCIKGTL